jgi:glycosyltransferase involved in cell wall biosynthesis
LDQLGFDTAFLSLRDMPVSHPTLLFPLNLPSAWSEIRNADFVHAIGDAAYAAALWKPFSHTPIIHDVDADTLAEARLQWETEKNGRTAFYIFQEAIMNRIAYRASDRFITVSAPFVDRLVVQKGVPPDRLHIVRNGVDTDVFRPMADAAKGAFTVCYAGGFHVWQGIGNMLAAARLLSKEPIRFKIVGFRSQDQQLKTKIADALGDRAELVDRVSQRELVAHLSAAHVLIIPRLPHPAVEIAFPTKFSEYLALGKPVIVTDVDETATMVREHRCGLVSESSPAALAETIRKAARLSQTELAGMGGRGRRLAETVFDWGVVCRGYADLLHQWHAQIGN